MFRLNMKISCGLEYIYDSPTTVIVNGIGYCDDKDIVVPDRLPNAKIVVGIAEKAYFRCDGISSVNLPATVNTIGAYAFSWCSDLHSIVAPGVVFVEERAFMGCKQLKTMQFSKRLESVEDKAFSYCTSLETVTLPQSLFFMGIGVFEGCRNLSSVVLPDKLTEINNSMFNACVNLKSVILPKKLRYIDEYAFAYCVSIRNMNISPRVIVNESAFYESNFSPDSFKVSVS